MADPQTKEQKLSGLAGFTDIVDLLNEVNLVQYKTGWTSKHLAADAIREITRLRQLLSEAEAALDEREIASGLTSNGNLWRFWAEIAKDMAVKLSEAEKRESEARAKALEEAAQVAARIGKRDAYSDDVIKYAFQRGVVAAAKRFSLALTALQSEER